jgi:hypothetical protein
MNTHTSKLEFDYIMKIADRALPLYAEVNLPDSKLTISMDLEFAHASSPIDLAALLVADDQTFNHDVLGIRRHMNRKTCKLEGCFGPRTALV